jgi:hypothetical protein
MKYFAAVGDKRELAAVQVLPPVRALFSYHYYKNKEDEIHEFIKLGGEAFIDSGAFSADSVGAKIDIDAYCEFIISCGAPLYAGLDVIGDAKATMKNVDYMERVFKLSPIPTFHMGSHLDDLRELMGEYPYIALGGLVFSPEIKAHCDRVWSFILREDPKLKVHGFGLTNLELMSRYPWYSVDSSSYKSCRRFGRQNILWGENFEFKTVQEKDYWKILQQMGYPDPLNLTNNERYFLYDLHSVQAYKTYAAHLTEVNKHKKFDYLTAQQNLF